MSEEAQDQFFTKTRRSLVYEPSKPKPQISKRAIFIILGIIILIGLVIFSIFASDGTNKNGIQNPAGDKNTKPTNIPTPTIEPTKSEESLSPTPKVTPTPTPSKSSALERGDLTIEVQNGSGVAGAATKASNILKKLGYDVVSTGNADSFDYETTVIKIKSTQKSYLKLLQDDLADDYTIKETSTSLTGSDADAIIIVGTK